MAEIMYLAVKCLHLISLVAWFAGLFYIFRLFVYHRRGAHETALCGTFEVMEAKLLRIIMLPASVVTVGSGVMMLVLTPAWLSQRWLHIKFLGVLGLLLYQWLAFRTQRRFAQKDFYLTEKACRMLNEVPTIFLILNVTMAVLKP